MNHECLENNIKSILEINPHQIDMLIEAIENYKLVRLGYAWDFTEWEIILDSLYCAKFVQQVHKKIIEVLMKKG